MEDAGRDWPTYKQLLEQQDAPPGSSWSTFGAGDELGTVNFMTPEVRRRAATMVRTGHTFNLDYALDAFVPFPSGTRPPAEHHMFQNNPFHRDDWLDSFYLQSSSQIDGLRHIGDPRYGFYGGTAGVELVVGTPTLGIQRWAEAGIFGRGVLLDVERYLAADGRPIDQTTATYISVEDLENTAVAQGITFEHGDVLIVRTGWAEYCRTSMDALDREAFKRNIRCPGLAQTENMVAWLWDHRFSLLAADNLGVEALPTSPESDFFIDGEDTPEKGVDHNGMLHRPLISLLGMALGEMWALEDLAEDCARDGVYEFLVVAKPLNIVGAAGSPANALAIK